MGVDGVPAVAVSWGRIDGWLASYAPAVAALLQPPVDPGDLELVERVLGVAVPADLAESLRCHDGAREWMCLLPEQSLLSAGEIVERWQLMMELAPHYDGFVTKPWDDEPWWHPLWMPWAEADGHLQVFDLRPGEESGRLGWALRTDGGDFSDAWPSLAAYLHEVAEALTHGGGVRGMYPYLASDGQLWWDDGSDCLSLNGEPITLAPTNRGRRKHPTAVASWTDRRPDRQAMVPVLRPPGVSVSVATGRLLPVDRTTLGPGIARRDPQRLAGILGAVAGDR